MAPVMRTAQRDGLLDVAAGKAAVTQAAPPPNPSKFLTQAPPRPSGEGTSPMMDDVTLSVVVTVIGIAALAVVYLVSGDERLRSRAWRLLELLLRR